MRSKYRILFTVLCLVHAISLFAQQKSFLLKNKTSGEPVPFAHIAIEHNGSISRTISNRDGLFYTETGFPLFISISCIGYKKVSDTLYVDSVSVIEILPDLFGLDEVVVTGQIFPRKSDKSVYNVSLLTKKDIEQKAAGNLTGLLSNELNIHLRQEGVLGRTLNIRGLGGEHIKILYNGMPVSGRQMGIIDLDQICLHNTDHIEIVEGPLSVIYGSNALGGAVNIITRQDATEKIRSDLGLYYETVGIYNANINLFYSLKDHRFGLHAARNFFSGFNPDKDSRFDIWKPKLQYIPGLNYSYTGKKIQASVFTDYLHEELRDKDSLSAANLFESADDRHYFTDRLNSGINISYKPSESSKIIAQSGFSMYRKVKNSFHINLVNLEKSLIPDSSLHDTTNFRMVSQRISYVKELKNLELISGFDLNYEYGSGKRLTGVKNIGDYAWFSSIIWSILPKLQLQPGIRFIYNTRYKAPVVYSFNLKYDISDFRFRASYAKGFRTPSLKELYMEFVDQNHRVYGNKNLSAETAENFNLSTVYLKAFGQNNLELKLDFFSTNIRNKIDFLFEYDLFGNLTSAKYFNLSGILFQTRGFSFSSAFFRNNIINLKSGLAFTGVSTLTEAGKFRYSPDVTSSVGYNIPKLAVNIVAYYKFTGKKYFFKNSMNDFESATFISEEFIDNYHNIDLTVSGRFIRQSIQISAGIKNILNNITVFSNTTASFHGVSDGNMPVGWGRAIFIRLNYSLKSKPL